MAVNIVFFFAVWLLLQLNRVFGIEDYCSQNTYNSSESFMHFTKEATFEEFAVTGKFKGLHCCAKGYRSIEWFKDGKLYPWALHVSHLILFPDSANQTIYTNSVSEEDAGNYTCVLRNDTVVHSHTIHLKVFEKVPDDPKITYISQNKNVAVGQTVRLFCEAFGGQIDLPDAHSEAVWGKVTENGTDKVPPHIQQLKNNREDGQIFGTYLIIPSVKREDFGDYVCEISKPGNTIERHVSIQEKVEEVIYLNPNPVPVGKMILFMSAILFISLAVIVLYLQYGLKIQVYIKDSFNPLEEDDGKSCDVLVVHAPQDSELAVGVLLTTLENNYNYKCCSRELSATTNMWYGDLQEDAQRCRRIIAVLSPAAVNDNWDSSNVLQALKQLQSLGPKLVCVSLKELPKAQNEVKNSQGETLTSLIHTIGVITWERKNDDKFWYSLRLRLPPKRRTEIVESINSTQGENNSRLTSNSQESLDNLV